MTDHPIIFSAPMILALLAGHKTMTRRLAYIIEKPKKIRGVQYTGARRSSPWQRVKPGDRLWVRETWGRFCVMDDYDEACSEMMTYYRADGEPFDRWIDPDSGEARDRAKWRSPIHCPRAYSRLTLVVTATKIERLNDISEADAQAEGIAWDHSRDPMASGPMAARYGTARYGTPALDAPNVRRGFSSARGAFQALWNSLHSDGAWSENPEVVALTFTVHKTNIDAMKVAA